MMALVEAFPDQLIKALEIAASSAVKESINPPRNVLISGLGGSGIGGTIVAEMTSRDSVCPVMVNKDYFAPSFIDQNSLVLICSYSGNTEETLNVLQEVLSKKAEIVVITSGGKALDLATRNHLEHVIIPGGMPPRSCLGYAMVQVLNILSKKKVISRSYLEKVNGAAQLLKDKKENIISKAQSMAALVFGKKAVIYSLGATEGVSIRLRQQLNENGKLLCWHHVLPEMNHNELVAWTESEPGLAVIILRYANEYFRNLKRLDVCENVFRKYTPHIQSFWAEGNNEVEEIFYQIHVSDWASCFLAKAKNVDASDISIINYLKDELAKI